MEKNIFDNFYELNYRFWNTSKINKNNPGILVFVDCNYLVPVIEAMLFTKKIQEELESEITVGYYFNYNEDIEKVYKSFGAERFINILTYNFFNIFKTISYIPKILCCNTAKQLLNFKIAGVPVGEEIYDDILRKKSLLTLSRIGFKNKKFILKYVYFYFSFIKLLERNNIGTFIYTDCDYDNSAFTKACLKKGVKIFQIGRGIFYEHKESINYKLITYGQITYEKYKKVLTKPNIRTVIENENKIHFAGAKNNYLDAVAFKGKRNYSKKELLELYNLSDNKRIVLVASHAFSDAPHGASFNIYFKDYYDWLVNTVVMLSKINKYHVFVKEHPSSAYYGEKGSIDKILKDNNLSNIYKIPDDLSTLCLYDFVDCFITCCGTIGIEAACFGIPVITAAKGYYYGYGLDYNAENMASYKNLLNNIEKLKKRPEIIDKAKVIMYLACQRYSDNVSSILPPDRFLESDKEICDEEKIKIIIDRLQHNNPKDEYYKSQLKNCFLYDNNCYPTKLTNDL